MSVWCCYWSLLFVAQTVTDVALGVTHAGLSIHPNRRYGKFLSHLFGLLCFYIWDFVLLFSLLN